MGNFRKKWSNCTNRTPSANLNPWSKNSGSAPDIHDIYRNIALVGNIFITIKPNFLIKKKKSLRKQNTKKKKKKKMWEGVSSNPPSPPQRLVSRLCFAYTSVEHRLLGQTLSDVRNQVKCWNWPFNMQCLSSVLYRFILSECSVSFCVAFRVLCILLEMFHEQSPSTIKLSKSSPKMRLFNVLVILTE